MDTTNTMSVRINIELPDWVDKKTITILANQELVARKFPKQEWMIKKVRCNQCGECCLDVPNGHTPFGSDDENKCNALKRHGDKWVCIAGHQKPFSCLGDPLKANVPSCRIEYF